jgi:hypothetical protein
MKGVHHHKTYFAIKNYRSTKSATSNMEQREYLFSKKWLLSPRVFSFVECKKAIVLLKVASHAVLL